MKKIWQNVSTFVLIANTDKQIVNDAVGPNTAIVRFNHCELHTRTRFKGKTDLLVLSAARDAPAGFWGIHRNHSLECIITRPSYIALYPSGRLNQKHRNEFGNSRVLYNWGSHCSSCNSFTCSVGVATLCVLHAIFQEAEFILWGFDFHADQPYTPWHDFYFERQWVNSLTRVRIIN